MYIVTDVSCQMSDICAQKISEHIHGVSLQSSIYRANESKTVNIDITDWFEWPV